MKVTDMLYLLTHGDNYDRSNLGIFYSVADAHAAARDHVANAAYSLNSEYYSIVPFTPGVIDDNASNLTIELDI